MSDSSAGDTVTDEQQQAAYYVLPDDPLAALNILREAAGLDRFAEDEGRTRRTDGCAS